VSITVKAQDAVHGRPATGLPARLERSDNGGWTVLGEAETDQDGRVTAWHGGTSERHQYRLTLNCDHYFARLGFTSVYPEIAIVFRLIDNTRSCEVDVLLSPNSYSTYVGAAD
jgi:5-hydroxyisourate hydrolase